MYKISEKLGPGLITGAADDDPSGIATYSQAGAQSGYDLLWTVILTYPLMVAIQLISARIGLVTGQGIASNIKKQYRASFLYCIVGLLIIVNTLNIAADLVAMGDSLKLLIGGYRHIYAAAFGTISLLLQVFIPYHKYVRILKWLTLVLFAYVAVVFTVHIPWAEVGISIIMPHFSLNPQYLMTTVAVFGTTISPYLFFWQASQEVEEMHSHSWRRPLKELPAQAPEQLNRIKVDTFIGMGFSNFIALFIMLTTATVLYTHHITDIQTSAQAAEALRPIAGKFAFLLFALGIIGTGLLAIPVLAGSVGYAVAETLKWPEGMELKLKFAKGFYMMIGTATVVGIILGFTSIDPISALYWSAVLNGVVAVPIMVVMMLMAVSQKVMGKFVIGLWLKLFGWGATIIMAITVIAMFFSVVN